MTYNTKIQEIYLPVKNYEGLYEVSNLGNIKSLSRIVRHPLSDKLLKERLLKTPTSGNGYLVLNLLKNGKQKTRTVHQLVAEAFLGFVPNGSTLVVNHINFIRSDNRIENLEIVTMRENTNQKHLKSTSKYVGVCWNKTANKWRASIITNRNSKHIGYFTNEYDAHLAYQKALTEI